VWWWVGLFAALAVAGLGVLVGYAVWLTHKAADVLSEVGSLAGLGAQLLDLLEQVRLPAERVQLPAIAPRSRTSESATWTT
jgi:hypothetical protein